MTQPWVSLDTEIWDYDSYDGFIWYPDEEGLWRFISSYDACDPTLGKINSGDLDNTRAPNDQKLILNELNTTPGFCYSFQHVEVPDSTASYVLHFQGTYGGDDSHNVEFQIYDWDSTAYVIIDTLITSTFTQDYYYNLPSGSQYFTTLGGMNNVMQIRVIHTSPGNSGHLFRINYWYLNYA